VENRHIGVVDLERRRHHGCSLLDAGLERFDTGDSAQRRSRGGHHQRSGQSLAHDVAQGDDEAAIRRAIPIVEISADLARRREMGGDLEPVVLIRC